MKYSSKTTINLKLEYVKCNFMIKSINISKSSDISLKILENYTKVESLQKFLNSQSEINLRDLLTLH